MSFWMILSWVFVAILTAINVFVFLKLKGASEQMLKMAFPNAKNMGEALGQMQSMMSGLGSGRGMPAGMPGLGGGRGGNMDAQLKAAMEMLSKNAPPRSKR